VALRVIQGGGEGPPDRDGPAAIEAFKAIAIELLRAMVRGNDREGRVSKNLVRFYSHIGKTRRDPPLIVDEALEQLNACIDTDPKLDLRDDLEHIVQASLRVAAESCCTDNAAQGRTSKRRHELETCIETMMQRRKQRRRDAFEARIRRPALNRPRKRDATTEYDAEAYERWQKGEIAIDELPSGKYPNGMRVYTDGEWEELVRKRPLGKLERAALEAYFKAKGSIGYVKGAGPATNDRLIARGFVTVVQEREAERVAYHGITPAGEAEWLRLSEQAPRQIDREADGYPNQQADKPVADAGQDLSEDA